MTGARIFVGLVFVALGASFLASTGLLIREFQGTDWLSMVVAHSHLFIFFPLLGILALVAFYLPAVIFTHLYWAHLPFGRLRFLAGLVAVGALTYWATGFLDKSPRALWEVSPQAFSADKGNPAGCGAGGSACQRASMPDVLTNLRQAGQQRVGLAKFARSCQLDEYLEETEDMRQLRYCFPAKAMLLGKACCEVQRRFSGEVDRLQADPAQRSLAATYDRFFMPLKIFFVLVVICIGVLLALWRDRVDEHYAALVPAMERGLIIGAFAMLFWPAMDYAYQTTSNIMFGRAGSGAQLRLSLVLAPWALLLLFYFLRRLGKQGEMIGQISGVIAGAVALLRYEELNDWAVRLLGIGTPPWMLAVLVGLAVSGFIGLIWPWRISPINADVAESSGLPRRP